MKNLLKIIFVVLVILGIWYLYNQSIGTPIPTNTVVTSNQTAVTHPDPSNATFDFEDGPITLKNGTNEKNIDPSGASVLETMLTDVIGYGDINNDKKDDAVVAIVQDGASSGVFIYIAAYVSAPLNYKGTNALFVGDRIEPKTITIKNGLITFTYLDRKNGEPMSADPTVITTKTYKYSNGLLVEA